MEELVRTMMLLGESGIDNLRKASVAVFGIGGVGSFAAEALVRAGVGRLVFVDSDTVSESNINRQLIALHSTVGRSKVDVMRERALDINANADIVCHDLFYTAESADEVELEGLDYIVDAIDTVSSKLLLIERAKALNIPLISCMGTGNKLHPEMLKIADISETSVCPLARVMRHELKKRGIVSQKVLYSEEIPLKPHGGGESDSRKQPPGSVSFVPSCAGLIIAGEVIRHIANRDPNM